MSDLTIHAAITDPKLLRVMYYATLQRRRDQWISKGLHQNELIELFAVIPWVQAIVRRRMKTFSGFEFFGIEEGSLKLIDGSVFVKAVESYDPVHVREFPEWFWSNDWPDDLIAADETRAMLSSMEDPT